MNPVRSLMHDFPVVHHSSLIDCGTGSLTHRIASDSDAAYRCDRLKLTMRPRVTPAAHSGRPAMGAPTIRAWPRAKKIACMRFSRTADCGLRTACRRHSLRPTANEPRPTCRKAPLRRTTYDERYFTHKGWIPHMSENYSVLMSVYYKEHPEYLRQSMQSIYDQTVPTDDFVLVCDGPLTPELDAVIADMQDQFGPCLRVCRLLKNGGLGKSLNFGIKQCKNDLVARMDSDDISRPDRCKRQLAVFADHPDYSIVSGIVEEFSDTPDNISVRRVVPEGQSEIIAFAKKRNPFNHPCVMYKKSAVEAAGGYQDFYLLEDYYLWIRMLQNGFQGYNLQEPLLWMRAGSDMYKRRGGWKYVQSQRSLFKYMAQTGFITYSQYQVQSLVRLIGAVMPNGLRALLFKKILRK